jgi:hypothetical protein
LTLGNPTDRAIPPRSIIITGASTSQEVPWEWHIPDVIAPRDGYEDYLNPVWLQHELKSDSAVIIVVETWDGESFRSSPADIH